MAFTAPPTPPNSGDPANFNSRADAFLGWFPGFVSQFNAELPSISSKYWATYGGTANALALTAGFVALAVGAQVRFRATATNTGAATINLDGTGAVACRTIAGVALPAGYIRTDADTIATYDGTYWVLDRQAERGSNANGEYVRFADGTHICTGLIASVDITTAIGGLFRSAALSWTFPAVFVGGSAGGCTITGRVHNASGLSVNAPYGNRTTDSLEMRAYSVASISAVPVQVQAIGRWY
ncbi:hypothetical protein [Paracoccus benzoatiresistens]|uniref:Uncharacterized protein n=1 Tax=Paracoccus benzoatiresistens TaxID=2997341 RepID=A0ABT4J9Z8_9RHOB|nr:hypothetical protein [Paracoccus sp. EF6]MCZ0963895.1 hypothetical protein [Paracoccus sp. EF6]